MLVEHKPDVVVAFPGSTGTANMVLIAEKAGVEVIRTADPSLSHAGAVLKESAH